MSEVIEDGRARVLMRHPDLPATAEEPVEVSRRQLTDLYADKGWVEAPEAAEPQPAPVEPDEGQPAADEVAEPTVATTEPEPAPVAEPETPRRWTASGSEE